MGYKAEIEKILEYLKKKNHSRRKIEEYFGYSEKYLDQILSRGGNETILNKLQHYKEEVDNGRMNIVNDPGVKYLIEKNPFKNKRGLSWSLFQLLFQEIAEDRARMQNKNPNECLKELYTKIDLIMQADDDA